MAIVIEDVINGRTGRLADLLSLFNELFPQYAHSAERLKIKASLPENANPNFTAHQWLVDVDGKAAAFNSFKYSRKRGLGLTVYIAVRPAYRTMMVDGLRFSEWLIRESIQQIQTDAYNCGQAPAQGLVLEVEPLHLLARYCEFGFVEFPVDYFEPLFARARLGYDRTDLQQIHFERRSLGYFPAPGILSDPTTPDLLTRAIMMLYLDHYGISDVHPVYQQMLNAIRRPVLESEK